MLHLRFEPCQVLLDLEVEEVFRRRSFLEEVVEVEGAPFQPQEEEEEEEEEEGVPFLPQEVVVEVEVEEVLRLQDLLEEVSVQSFCAPNWLVGVGK